MLSVRQYLCVNTIQEMLQEGDTCSKSTSLRTVTERKPSTASAYVPTATRTRAYERTVSLALLDTYANVFKCEHLHLGSSLKLKTPVPLLQHREMKQRNETEK